jgi:VWFA-related protein
MRRMVVAVALLFAVSSQSQQSVQKTATPQGLAAAPPPLVEKIEVSVVNVDVTVTDRHGQPVSGLTRNDFEIQEDGKPQPVSNFYAVENAQARSDDGPAAATPEETPERFRRKVLVLIDNLNTTPHGRNVALDNLERFVNDHFSDGRYDWSIATIDSRIHVALPMTSDKKALHAVVGAIRNTGTLKASRASAEHAEFNSPDHFVTPQPELIRYADKWGSNGTINAFEDERALNEQMISVHSSTDAIVDAARAFGSSEGKKIILLVTGYLPLGTLTPFNRYKPDPAVGGHIGEVIANDNELDHIREVLTREANASNTSIYIIGAEGLETPPLETITAVSDASRASLNTNTAPMLWLAKETGGAYLPGNRIDQSLADFDRRSASFYSLGYVPPHPEDTLYHRLTVKVKGHRGYQLQYRDGYSSAPTDLQIMRSLRSSLGVQMQPSSLPVSLIFGRPQYRGVVALVPLKASMSMESLQYITDARGSRTRLHIYVSIFDPDGRNITMAKAFADIAVKPSELASGPMTITIPPLELAKGTYRVVVAMRDELTDHVGLVSQRIDI